MTNFLKKPTTIISIILLAALIAGGYAYFGRTDKSAYDFIVVGRRDLVQEVSVTGRVKPAESVELAFEKSGKVSAVYADVGTKADVGQTLVILENADIAAQLAQAEAILEKDEARLAELKRGTRPEEIQIQETKVANAKIALEDAKNNLVDKLQDAYTKADDAIRNKVNKFFSNPESQNPQLSFVINDSQLEIDIEWQKLILQNTFASWKSSLDTLTAVSDLASYVSETKMNLNQVKSFLDKAALAVNSLTPHSNLSQTTIDAWKSDVATARTNVNTAINNVTAAEEKWRAVESNLALEENNLALKKAGTIEEQITAQEAQVKTAKANVDYYRAQLAKTVLRAPISGVVTKQDAKIGEIVSANTTIVSLISASQFEIEANVPEADIAKVKVGNDAKVTLDAYGRDVVFEATVTAIDPAETVIDGVATYKTTLQFLNDDERIKSGMTANIDILGDKRENVLAVPQRAIIRKNGDSFVRIVDGESFKEVKVEIGLRGSGGNIEIISGINEGDRVIIFGE